MACKISKLSLLLKKKRTDVINDELAKLRTEMSSSVTICGAKAKVCGVVLHVSKSKKLNVSAVNKNIGDKRSRRELAYHRLVFCRENADVGTIFALLFRNEDKELFLLSTITVGKAITIVSPVLDGEWNSVRVLRSNEPCFSAEVTWLPFLPIPFPDSGYIAFCMENIKIRVVGVQTMLACCGPLCDGLYGTNNCSCVRTVHLPQPVLCFQLGLNRMDENGSEVDLCHLHGLKLQDFSSRSLTSQLVGMQELQEAVSINDDNLLLIMNHAEKQLEMGNWSVLGWWKGSSITKEVEASVISPKCHIVAIRREDGLVEKWNAVCTTATEQPQNPAAVPES